MPCRPVPYTRDGEDRTRAVVSHREREVPVLLGPVRTSAPEAPAYFATLLQGLEGAEVHSRFDLVRVPADPPAATVAGDRRLRACLERGRQSLVG